MKRDGHQNITGITKIFPSRFVLSYNIHGSNHCHRRLSILMLVLIVVMKLVAMHWGGETCEWTLTKSKKSTGNPAE